MRIRNIMNWNTFRKQMSGLACFTTHPVYAGKPDFDRNNFYRWTKAGYLVRLRQGLYTFPEYKEKPEMAAYFAGRIYGPSYISLHTALAFYGLIPEAVVQITSVTALKTMSFTNAFGEYTYQSVRDDLMFGYEPRPFGDGYTIAYATREKGLLDLLYLYPFYNTPAEMENLRLDHESLHEDLQITQLESFLARFKSLALEKRVRLFRKVYEL
jgi:predicted transcriptional regulator of viral defense system